MPEHQQIRRRVSWALVALGSATLVYMVASFNLGWPSLTGVTLLGLVMGLALRWGPLSTTRKMTWCLALWLTVYLGMSLILPLIQPWGVTLAKFRAEPLAQSLWMGYRLALMAFLLWAYTALRRPAVCDAMANRGVHPARPWVAFGLGAVVVVGLAGLEFHLSYSEAARTARTQARLQHGLERTYDVYTMTLGDNGGRAVLGAYSADGVEQVRVTWGDWLLRIEPTVIPRGDACRADGEGGDCRGRAQGRR